MTDPQADLELVLGVGGLADSDRELAPLAPGIAVEIEHVSEVRVRPFVERAEQSNLRLDRGDRAAPGDLRGHGCPWPPCMVQAPRADPQRSTNIRSVQPNSTRISSKAR